MNSLDNCSIAHTSAHGVRRKWPSERRSRRSPTAPRRAPRIHLADQLPPEIGEALRHGVMERFDVDAFIERIAARERMKASTASFHAHLVLSLLSEVVSYGIMLKVRSELPAEFETLFMPERGAGTVQPAALLA